MSSVLVVDDSKTLRNVLRRSLTMAGVPDEDIAEATDGLEALEAIRQKRPDVVLSDVNMPNMTGLELLRELRGQPETADLPVVIITSVSNTRTMLEIVRLGASKVIRKPFDPISLPDALEPFLPQPPPPPEPEPYYDPGMEAVDHTYGQPPTGASLELVHGDGFDPPTLADELESDDEAIAAEAARWAAAVEQSILSVLERMIFAMAEAVDEELPQDKIIAGAEIEVQNAAFTVVQVSAPLSTARLIAERILGEPVGEEDHMALFDCVAEVANILVGDLMNILSNEEGQEDQATFGLPRRIACAPGEPLPLAPRIFELDGEEHRVFIGVGR